MKKVGLVLASTMALACAAVAPSALGSDISAGSARAVGPTVSVQIKTLTKTLLGPTDVRGRTGWITKGGTPRGKCSAASAAGALKVATQGRWSGKYFSGVGIFVTSILGVKPKGMSFWAVYVNGKFSSVGICGIKLRAGERLLFKIKK
jgi:Domain of unknown function (DUF4430)